MENLFAPYAIAILAHDKGFDEICMAEWVDSKLVGHRIGIYSEFKNSHRNHDPKVFKSVIAAPVYAQLVTWFREQHQIFIDVVTDCTSYPKYAFEMHIFTGNPKDLTEKEWGWDEHKPDRWFLYRTYNEALNNALTEAFKLI